VSANRIALVGVATSLVASMEGVRSAANRNASTSSQNRTRLSAPSACKKDMKYARASLSCRTASRFLQSCDVREWTFPDIADTKA